jgi:hypothetical protein
MVDKMQVLYVVKFDVALTTNEEGDRGPGLIVLDLLGKWVGGASDPSVTAASLMTKGELEITDRHPDVVSSRATWEYLGGEGIWASRLERRDTNKDGSQFITRVTVGESQTGTTVRVSMAREVAGTGLAPRSAAILMQPWLVTKLVTDERLVVRADGPTLDGRYLQVRSPREVEALAEALQSEQRLPVLLLHTRTLESQRAAASAARRLVGLVRVVTLDYRAARHLESIYSSVQIAYAGGVLVWADIAAPPLPILPEELNAPDAAATLWRRLMSLIAPLSVLIRGDDEAFRVARRASQALQARHAAKKSADAGASGDTKQQIEALQQELDQAHADVAIAVDQWQEAQDAADAFAQEAARLRAQVEQLDLAMRFQDSTNTTEQPIRLESAPALEAGDVKSLDALCQHIEQSTAGRIVFTDNVLSTWRKADRYPTPELMRAALLKLANVAYDLYDGQDRSMGHIDTWIRETYDLRVSLQDDQMPKKFRTGFWEGERYDYIPHVKVNDGVPPQECERIYFTFDKDNDRLLVDKIGLHW